jgi:hypothetical protein
VNKLFVLRHGIKELHRTYCFYHTRDGEYYEGGTLAYLEHLADLRLSKQLGLERPVFEPLPLCLDSFRKFRPKDCEEETWQTAACPWCLEVEGMMAVWIDLVRYAHGIGKQNERGRTVLQHVPPCTNAACPYHNKSIKLPVHALKRFKNLISNRSALTEAYPDPADAPPDLFCGECGCATCATAEEQAEPVRARYLHCRRMEGLSCNRCGWSVKYPPCPTLLKLATKFQWRCRHATAVALGQASGPAPKAKRGGGSLTDVGVDVTTTFPVFFETLNAKMSKWVSHEYRHQHSFEIRRRAVASVAKNPPCWVLVILTDWADKLVLAPGHGVTAGKYF